MRKGIATPETNNGKKLVIPVRTLSVLEAHQALSLGHPIDRMGGYYEQEGVITPDFFMMDRVQKFHALADAKEKLKESRVKYDSEVGDLLKAEEQRKLDELVNAEIQKRQINEQSAKTKE